MPALPIINLPYSDRMVGMDAARAVQDSFAADQRLERDRYNLERDRLVDQQAQQDRANEQAADAAKAGLVTGAGTGLSRARAQPDMRTPGFAPPTQQPTQAPRVGLGAAQASAAQSTPVELAPQSDAPSAVPSVGAVSPLRTARALRQDAAQALAGIPGMGGKALDLMMDGLDEEEKATATAMAEILDLADRDPNLAIRRAQQKGLPLDETDIAILTDRAARARARSELEATIQKRKDELELAKIDSERAQAQQRLAEAAKAGRDELVPVEENGVTVYRPRSEAVGKPVGVKPGQGAGGAAPSEVQTAQWLVKEGVANNAGDAWRMVREAKTNPNARAEMAIKVMELSGADPADPQARAQAEAVVDGLLGPATTNRAVPPPTPGAPGGQPTGDPYPGIQEGERVIQNGVTYERRGNQMIPVGG